MQSVNNFYQSYIKNTTYSVLKAVSNKSVDAYHFSKQQVLRFNGYMSNNFSLKVSSYLSGISWLKYQTYQPFLKSLSDTLNNPTTNKIKQVVSKYGLAIANLPGVRDVLITTFLKITGFTAAGVKSGSMAALIQSKFYGAYIAKGSLFSYLQSIGATCWFDPTLLTLLLLGGTLFYYWYVYRNPANLQNAFKWETKDIIKIPEITVPKNANYQNGKFNIEWKNLNYDDSQYFKNFKQQV